MSASGFESVSAAELRDARDESVPILAELVEQLAIESGRHAERSQIRRVIGEAFAQQFSSTADHCWESLANAARGLGLSFRLMDCTCDQIAELILNGAQVIARGADSGR